jgi:hydroxymethylbilane synthase
VNTLRIGTRGSALARWQAQHIADLLHHAHPLLSTELVIISTQGDQRLDVPMAELGGKGAFTGELERALYEQRIDMAIHSLKDLPTRLPEGLIIGAVAPRADVHDVLISKHVVTLASLPHSATIGTGSTRRKAQLLHFRPDLNIISLRGNVDTRIAKALAHDGAYDAIVLASAGVERLEKQDVIREKLALDMMLPAPSQGAIAVQCQGDSAWLSMIEAIDHAETHLAVTLERAFLAGLGSGCSLPVGAYAHKTHDEWHLQARVLTHDGAQRWDTTRHLQSVLSRQEAQIIGRDVANEALTQGVATWLRP